MKTRAGSMEAGAGNGEMVLLTPAELAARYGVAYGTVLQWFHQGVIPAAVAVGKVYRFCPVEVAAALRERAEQQRAEKAADQMMVI